MNAVAPLLNAEKENAPGDFYVDEKNHTVLLSEEGHEAPRSCSAEQACCRRAAALRAAYVNLMHHLNARAQGQNLFFRDRTTWSRTAR